MVVGWGEKLTTNYLTTTSSSYSIGSLPLAHTHTQTLGERVDDVGLGSEYVVI